MRFLLEKLTEADLNRLWDWRAYWRKIAYVSLAEVVIFILLVAAIILIAPGFYKIGGNFVIEPSRILPGADKGSWNGPTGDFTGLKG